MRFVLIGLLMAGLALAASETVAANPSTPPVLTPGYMTSMELSRDNGNIANAWIYYNGVGAYAGDQYDVPAGGPWYLYGIKYYVWAGGWPDSAYQGFGVACWAMTGGTPGSIVCPTSGSPIYNPNSGGNWIIQPVYPDFPISSLTTGFLVGICFLYAYPTPGEDGLGTDNTTVGAYDWAMIGGGSWGPAPYGKQTCRALVEWFWWQVETTTMGQIRALYR